MQRDLGCSIDRAVCQGREPLSHNAWIIIRAAAFRHFDSADSEAEPVILQAKLARRYQFIIFYSGPAWQRCHAFDLLVMPLAVIAH